MTHLSLMNPPFGSFNSNHGVDGLSEFGHFEGDFQWQFHNLLGYRNSPHWIAPIIMLMLPPSSEQFQFSFPTPEPTAFVWCFKRDSGTWLELSVRALYVLHPTLKWARAHNYHTIVYVFLHKMLFWIQGSKQIWIHLFWECTLGPHLVTMPESCLVPSFRSRWTGWL